MPEFDSGTVYRTGTRAHRDGVVVLGHIGEWACAANVQPDKTGEVFLNGWVTALQNYQSVIQKGADGLRAEER